MSDWKPFVRDRLKLPQLVECRQRDLVDEVAAQLEDIEFEAMERGCSDADAREAAASHILDWEVFAAELLHAEAGNRRSMAGRLAEHSEDRLLGSGGWRVVLADVLQDVHYSVRSLRKSPGFTAVALLTLVLGIAGAATIFTFYDHVLLRPLAYPESEELVELWEKMASFENASVSYPNFLDWRQRNRVFEDMAVWNDMSLSLTGGEYPVEVTAARISASLPSILRVNPVLGRSFRADEDAVDGAPVVMLAYGFWQRRFAGDPEIIGTTISLDQKPTTVVGIMPSGFRYPPSLNEVQVYIPIEQYAAEWIENRGNHPGLLGLARLKPGVDLETARADMERVAMELEVENPDSNTGSRVHVSSLHARVTRDARDMLVVLLLSVALLMLIACLNVANLVLARASSRMHEMAVRASMGASRARIIRLMLIDSLVLWTAGSVLGLFFAGFGVRALASQIADDIPWVFQIGLDLRVAVFALALSLLTGMVFGLAPALFLSRQDPKKFLIDGTRHTGGVGRALLRRLLVVSEVGLAVALLIGAGLTLRSYGALTAASPGLDPVNVLTVEFNLTEIRYSEAEDRSGFYRRLLAEVRSHPGVVSAATAFLVPLGPGGWQNTFHAQGAPPERDGQLTFAEVNAVSSAYFQTMGIPLLGGRDFTEADRADAPPVVIIDQATAELYWPDEEAVGKHIKWGGYDSESSWMEVVGVAGRVHVNGVMDEPLPQVYLPHWQDNDSGYFLMMKTIGDPLLLTRDIRHMVLALDPTQPLGTVGTMESWRAATTVESRFTSLLMGFFAIAALLLAAVGVYGVMAQMTAERRREIVIRVALGASGENVIALVLRQGLNTIAVGVGLGFAVSLALGRLVSSQLYQISATDPLTYTLAPLLVALIATAANLLPARAATTVDPARVLQAE